ncbi:MAG: dephospho-CoA kinase, partial [Rickettsiales bacterium]|nr:dephospho-CoA kinase [Rickettsiales bacterium]
MKISKFPIIAVTGSIASGKSYFTKKLSQIRGIKTFSSDEMVHSLYANRNFAEKLIKVFGEGIANSSLHIRESGYPQKTIDSRLRWNESEPLINRQKLGEIVFKNPNKKKLLESLVYPELSRQRQEII